MYPIILVVSSLLCGIIMSGLGQASYWFIPAFFAFRYLHIKNVPQALYPASYLGAALGMVLFSHISAVMLIILWMVATLLPQVDHQLLRAANPYLQNVLSVALIYFTYIEMSGGIPAQFSAIVMYCVSIGLLAGVGLLPFFDRERGGYRVA